LGGEEDSKRLAAKEGGGGGLEDEKDGGVKGRQILKKIALINICWWEKGLRAFERRDRWGKKDKFGGGYLTFYW